MSDFSQLFFQLLQVSIGKRKQWDAAPGQEEWAQLFAMAEKQSLTGICLAGVEKLSARQSPGEELVMQWVGRAMRIRQLNHQLDDACRKLCGEFDGKGFETCILKGQSNHVYYPAELASRRTPGDVDIWLFPKGHPTSPVRQTMQQLEREDRIVSLTYLHAELQPLDGVAVEAHFRPTYLNEPVHNHRLQQWFDDSKSVCMICRQTAGGLTIPMLKPVYNIIFQLVHIYRHLLDEGIGLRQLLDYYFLLTETVKSLSDAERSVVRSRISAFGLHRIAGAVMYVLHEVFLMDSSCMIVPADAKYGRQLLDEIMIAGNFGHYDPRLKDIGAASHETHYQIRHALRRFSRNTRFLSAYPAEVIWEPVTRIARFWWRKFKLWRFG